ncbi:type III polyketide synthase [Estrella lausannensis]|uniref:Chalcone synthase n=1 Tax=Estrella lausannensis TaxID=483423 RepID=A0A0H5DPI1_9BACT|nr:type III polyketide synthase [Estrella lausannensis]CRX37903.1 hypothetical protein ELAC_0548 [Estrella lausannensis]
MTVSILSLATKVPEASLNRETFVQRLQNHLSLSPEEAHFLKKVVRGTSIEKRHSVVADMFNPDSFPSVGQETSARSLLYQSVAPALAEDVSRAAVESWGGNVEAITHVISVSCTGCIAPGIEFLLVDRLGLSRSVERLGINFMGCFGAFKGLAVAKALALENPKNRVLLVCTELCSLHFQHASTKETLVANSLFGDGAAAVVVGALATSNEKPLLSLKGQASLALPGSLDLMTWSVGDTGFKMELSPKVPEAIGEYIVPFSKKLAAPHTDFHECTFAVHPGGRAIVETVAKACSLNESQLEASWSVLRQYGNMSSPTFLFVLDEVLKKKSDSPWVLGLGFGPGLSIEGLLLKRE